MITANKNHRHAAASGGSQSHSRRSISCAKAWAIWPDLTSGCDDLTFWSPWYPQSASKEWGSSNCSTLGCPFHKMGDDGRTSWRPNLGPLCQNDPYLKVISTDISWLNALVGENQRVWGLARFWTHRVTHPEWPFDSSHLCKCRNIKMSAMEHPHQYPCSRMVAFPVRKLWSISDLWRKTIRR